MTRVAAALVPEQKSDLSTSRQSIPCSANSLNKPIPLMPPPTIRTETLGWSCSEVNCGRIRIPSRSGIDFRRVSETHDVSKVESWPDTIIALTDSGRSQKLQHCRKAGWAGDRGSFHPSPPAP